VTRKSTPGEGKPAADTWVSPVPSPPAPDATPRARVEADAHVSERVIVARADRERGDAIDDAARCRDNEEVDVGGFRTTFAIGTLVDSRYRVQRFVGRGGMGEVYEAHDQLMDRQVALKTILRSVADRSRAARRFKQEVRNAQRVAHPHVCRIHDLHEHHDGGLGPALPFLTMELIDGERLGDRLLAAALPIADVRRVALQLLGGLAAAHARGVLHLDFKSDNVMLRRGTQDPEAMIMDFGLSRVLGERGGLRTSEQRQFAGTLPYMSIEQLECRESLGPATDVYAFGVVLYEMLTRKLPFDGDSLGAVLMRQLKERPRPPSRRVPGLAPALDRFVLRCLNRDPRERFADGGGALDALSAIAEWTRPHRALARWHVAWPAAALVAAGAAMVSTRSEPPGAPAPRVRAPSAEPQRELVRVAAGLTPMPASRAVGVTFPSDGAAEPAPAQAELAPAPRVSRLAADEAEWQPPSGASLRPLAAAPAPPLSRGAPMGEPPAGGEPRATTPGDSRAATAAEVPAPTPGVAGPAFAPAPPVAASARPDLASSARRDWTPRKVPKRLSVPAPNAVVEAPQGEPPTRDASPAQR
jgi:hypothetical protein